MKLSAQQIESIERQLGAEPIAEDNPAMDTLKSQFGDHTFYADTEGLSVLEPLEADSGGHRATVVQVATWADDQKTALVPHDPLVRDIVVDLESGPPQG